MIAPVVSLKAIHPSQTAPTYNVKLRRGRSHSGCDILLKLIPLEARLEEVHTSLNWISASDQNSITSVPLWISNCIYEKA